MPFATAWIATLVPVAAGAAMGLLLASITLLRGTFSELYFNNFGEPIIVPILAWIFLLEIPLAACILLFRRRFLRLPRFWQLAICLTANAGNWLGLGLLAVTIH
ncbi:MAG TPA: hypothetical protein VMD30_07820 [Tepidisphaeraceae bacterium]|nr:hypothetical protein [Tepidisphaeraceae bacterium]